MMLDLDASWWTITLPLVVAVALLAIPGGIVVLLLRLRGLAAVALAPVASIAILAGAGVLTQLAGRSTLPWATIGLTAALAIAAHFIGRASPTRRAVSGRRGSTWWIAGAVTLAALVTAIVSFAGVSSPSLPNQTYDGIFHLNLALWIQSTGETSAFQAYHMTNPLAGNAFYPNAWHLLAVGVSTIAGANMPTAFAALWIAMCGAIWIPGIVWATDVIVRPRHRTLTLTGAALLASAFPFFPYLLLNWGTLYPTALAMSMLPAGLAILVLATRALRGVDGELHRTALIVATLGWGIALSLAHPRTFFTFAVLAVPHLVWQGASVLRRRLGGPSERRAAIVWAIASTVTIAVVAAVGIAGLLYTYRDEPVGERLNGGPATAHFTLWEGLWQALAIAPPTSPGDTVVAPSIFLGFAVLAAAVFAAARTELRWLFITWGAIWVLYLLAAASNDDLAKLLTGVWYKDKYRILAALPIVAVPMLAAGADALASSLPRKNVDSRSMPVVTAGLLAIVLIASLAVPTLPQLTAQTAGEHDATGSIKAGRALDADDVAVLAVAAETVPKGEKLLGDPWQGAIASWVVAGIEPVFPHYTGAWDPDRLLIAEGLPGASPEVCEALDRIGAHYVLLDVEQTTGRDPGAQEFSGLDADAAALGETVASAGSARLVRLTGCR